MKPAGLSCQTTRKFSNILIIQPHMQKKYIIFYANQGRCFFGNRRHKHPAERYPLFPCLRGCCNPLPRISHKDRCERPESAMNTGLQRQKAHRHIEIFRGRFLALQPRRHGAFRPCSRSLVRNAGYTGWLSGACRLAHRCSSRPVAQPARDWA